MPPQSKGKSKQWPGLRSSSDSKPGAMDVANSDDRSSSRAGLSHKSQPEIEGVDAAGQLHAENEENDTDSYSSIDEDLLSHTSSEDDNEIAQAHRHRAAQAIPDAAPRPNLASRSKSYGPAAFAPPFYNRPPTPLPPSPSLTSLLRPPSFSAPLSHQTTPDSSDTEAAMAGLTPTAAAVAQSARAATTVPRASPKVPTYEYYGFVVYLGSSLAFLMYLLWSYLPTPLLHKLGIYYYPNRWWSLAVPAWLIVAVLYVYVALAAWNTGVLTLPLSSLECFVDEKAQIAVVDTKGKIVSAKEKSTAKRKGGADSSGSYGRLGLTSRKASGFESYGTPMEDLNWREVWNEGTDAVMDIPLGGVCEILYGSGRKGRSEQLEP